MFAGQLSGSLGAAAFHLLLRRYGGAAVGVLQPAPLLLAALLLAAAGRFAAQLRPVRAGVVADIGETVAGGGGPRGAAGPLLVC